MGLGVADKGKPLQELFEGLRAVSEQSFPKKCANCGKIYQSAQEFISDTEDIRGRSGLKSALDDDGAALIELYRNCRCGSTLMDFFNERRDDSAQGRKRREACTHLISVLMEQGLGREEARREIRQWGRGEPCPHLERLGVRSPES